MDARLYIIDMNGQLNKTNSKGYPVLYGQFYDPFNRHLH
jgi:hypothetical protein